MLGGVVCMPGIHQAPGQPAAQWDTVSKKQANKTKLAIFNIWVDEMAGESAYYASLAPLVKSPESAVLFCDLHGMCTHRAQTY